MFRPTQLSIPSAVDVTHRHVLDLDGMAGDDMVCVKLTLWPHDRTTTLDVIVNGRKPYQGFEQLTVPQMRVALALAAMLYEHAEREGFWPSDAEVEAADMVDALAKGDDVPTIPSPTIVSPQTPEPWFPGKDERDDKTDGETPDSAAWGG